MSDKAELFKSKTGSFCGTHNGQTKPFSELPGHIQDHIKSLYNSEPKEVQLANRTHFRTDSYQKEVEQWGMCNFGGFDKNPDFSAGETPKKEYWDCGLRGKCDVELCVCQPDCISNFKLSLREVEIIKCIADGLTSGEVGVKLEISEHTVHTHERKIKEKLNLNTRGQIVKFAYQNNIIF